MESLISSVNLVLELQIMIMKELHFQMCHSITILGEAWFPFTPTIMRNHKLLHPHMSSSSLAWVLDSQIMKELFLQMCCITLYSVGGLVVYVQIPPKTLLTNY